MDAKTKSDIDMEKYRLRRFIGEVDIHDEPVPLTGLSTIIEGTERAQLFRKTGPEQMEIVAKTAGNRKRLAAAFETSEDKLYDDRPAASTATATAVTTLARLSPA